MYHYHSLPAQGTQYPTSFMASRADPPLGPGPGVGPEHVVPLQKLAYEKLMSHKFGNPSLTGTIEKRLTHLFLPFELNFPNYFLLERCFDTLKKYRVSEATKVLKCWCNGWATSYRYHEDKLLPCLFGCSGCKGELGHYLQCPHLFALWRFLTGEVSRDPLVR